MKRRGRAARAARGLMVVAVIGAAAFVAGDRLARPAQSQDAPPPPPQDACELVTEQEAEAALGNPVIATPAAKTCSYTSAVPGEFASLAVAMGPDEIAEAEQQEGGEDAFAQAMQTYAEAANAELRHAVAGDEAWATLTDQASQVIARSGDRFVTIILLNVQTPEAERIATMQDLAQKALSRRR